MRLGERKWTRNLIFEGISRVGKTTLINELSSKLNLPIKKYQNPKSKKETIELFSAYLMVLRKENCIWDRGHLSELVYGPFYRPGNYLDQILSKLLFTIDHKLAKENLAVTIYLWPLSQHILDFTGREQYKVNFRRDLDKYTEIINKSNLPTIKMAVHEVIPGRIPQWKSTGNIVDQLLIKLRSYNEF